MGPEKNFLSLILRAFERIIERISKFFLNFFLYPFRRFFSFQREFSRPKRIKERKRIFKNAQKGLRVLLRNYGKRTLKKEIRKERMPTLGDRFISSKSRQVTRQGFLRDEF